MELEETKAFGYDRAAGIYSLVENLAQSAGPLMFGYILIFGLSSGLKILTAGIILLALFFLMLSLGKACTVFVFLMETSISIFQK
jgi:hypothetical protein